jgi:hypothetical protein
MDLENHRHQRRGIPDGVVDTDVLADNAVVFGKIGTTEQGQLCKAWVNFNGTGTVAIRQSYNVSSITDNGEGLWTVNMSSALVDANYMVCASSGEATDTASVFAMPVTSFTTSAFSLRLRNNNGTQRDSTYIGVAIFR